MGEIVWTVDPHTEADPVATLVQLLVAFGNMAGRGAISSSAATRHYLNLFTTPGWSARPGRKGSSWDVVRWLLSRPSTPNGRTIRIQGGLVCGEGLIYHVRDPVSGGSDVGRAEEKNGPSPGTRVVIDREGVADKRLLIVETELSRVMKAMNRDNNTLSDVIRQAWESGNLRTMAKQFPAKATDAHISIVAHTTRPTSTGT